MSNQNYNESNGSNYNNVSHIVLLMQKYWFQYYLTVEENYIQYHQNEVTELSSIIEETERFIHFELYDEIRDNHRLDLQRYNNQLWNLSGNLLLLEEEYDQLRNDVLYEIYIIDTLIGNNVNK